MTEESNDIPEWLKLKIEARILELQEDCYRFRGSEEFHDLVTYNTFMIRELYGVLSLKKPEETP